MHLLPNTHELRKSALYLRWACKRLRGGPPWLAHVMSTPAPPSADVADGRSVAAQLRPALIKFFKRKTGNAVEAEDLAQEVIVRALAHAHMKAPAQAYIFRAALNLWRDRRRRLRVRGLSVEWDESAAAEIGTENSPERVLLDQEELQRVVRALRTLDPRARTALMLVKLERMKIPNVAQVLGVSVRTVGKDLARAAARLARLRKSEELDP
jgi:RNA polymerase sigma factor (sigma-70 family)